MKNLYLVSTKGCGLFYVVSSSLDAAYQRVRDSLDDEKIGFVSDRALKAIELIAEYGENHECGNRLYL